MENRGNTNTTQVEGDALSSSRENERTGFRQIDTETTSIIKIPKRTAAGSPYIHATKGVVGPTEEERKYGTESEMKKEFRIG